LEGLNFENLKPQKQDDAQASHCKKISKSDGLFSFDEEAGQIYNKFRALTPWPGIYLANGLKILSLELSEKSGKSGEILTKRQFNAISLVKKGETLNAVLIEGSVNIIAEVKALEDGNLGDMIKIRTKDNKILEATVSGKGQAIIR